MRQKYTRHFPPPKVSWILLLMIPWDLEGSDQNKTHCNQGGSRRRTQSLSAIPFCLVLSGCGVLPPSSLHLSITWTESGIMFCQLIQKEEGTRKKSHQPGHCKQGLTHILFPNSCTCASSPTTILPSFWIWTFFGLLAWLQKWKYPFVVFHRICYAFSEEMQRKIGNNLCGVVREKKKKEAQCSYELGSNSDPYIY